MDSPRARLLPLFARAVQAPIAPVADELLPAGLRVRAEVDKVGRPSILEPSDVFLVCVFALSGADLLDALTKNCELALLNAGALDAGSE